MDYTVTTEEEQDLRSLYQVLSLRPYYTITQFLPDFHRFYVRGCSCSVKHINFGLVRCEKVVSTLIALHTCYLGDIKNICHHGEHGYEDKHNNIEWEYIIHQHQYEQVCDVLDALGYHYEEDVEGL